MDLSTAAIRALISSAFAALIAALFVVGIVRYEPDPKAGVRIPAPLSSAPAKNQGSMHASLGPYVGLRPTNMRRTNRIDSCFTLDIGVTTPASPRETALVTAALGKDWQSVQRMFNAGASVESANDAGVTPLMAAASQGNAEMIGVLLRRGANANTKDRADSSALYYAIRSGNLMAVQTLLPLSSDLETGAGSDLLSMAVEAGEIEIFHALLEHLPSTLQWTANTRTALDMALRDDKKEEVRLLLSKHREPPTPDGGTVPLIAYAIANDDASLFHTLLACGSDPNIVIPKTAEKEFLSLLKSKYLRLYIQEETGINLLMLAAGLGRTEYVRALLDSGADRRRATPREHMLPLYFAAWTANWQCVQLLLGGGPMPDELRLEISLAKQRMAVVKDGVTVLTTHCSTGREGFATPTGRFVITDKNRDHRSSIYKVPMPYFMRLNCRDFGMHAGVVPRYPASHGCIRLPSEVARKLFTEIPVGTVVMIN